MKDLIGRLPAALIVLLTAVTISSCSTARDPYNNPDSQRDRSKGAQDEMRRSTGGY